MSENQVGGDDSLQLSLQPRDGERKREYIVLDSDEESTNDSLPPPRTGLSQTIKQETFQATEDAPTTRSTRKEPRVKRVRFNPMPTIFHIPNRETLASTNISESSSTATALQETQVPVTSLTLKEAKASRPVSGRWLGRDIASLTSRTVSRVFNTPKYSS